MIHAPANPLHVAASIDAIFGSGGVLFPASRPRTAGTLQTVAVAAFVMAGVFGGGTAILAIVNNPRQGPTVSTNTNGTIVGWRGTW